MNASWPVIVTAMGSALMASCATTTAPVAARLNSSDAATLATVKAAAAQALGRGRIELGAVDFATSTTVPVLPLPVDPIDGRSLATPILFDIVKTGQVCALVSRTNAKTYPLDGVTCTPVAAGNPK